MRRGRKFLTIYFVVFGALSLLAVIPGVPLMVLLLTSMALPLFGAPGFLVIASPTILLYSSALVPLWRALAVPGRGIWPIAIALAAGFPIAAGNRNRTRHALAERGETVRTANQQGRLQPLAGRRQTEEH